MKNLHHASNKDHSQPDRYPRRPLIKRLFNAPVQAQAVIKLDDVIGEIDPRIYGLDMPNLENFLSSVSVSPNNQEINPDAADLIGDLQPPLIRCSVSAAKDPSQSGLDSFIGFCQQADAEPYLVIEDGPASPEDAARWVAYCNDHPDTKMGAKRASSGGYNPYQVKLWGLGSLNEGDKRVEGTDPAAYVERTRSLIEAMRAADPGIKLVAAGLPPLEGDPLGVEAWNRTILEGIGDRIDYLSCRLYHPDETVTLEDVDTETLYHSLLSAPHSAEDAIRRMADQISDLLPGRAVGIALDAYNIQSSAGTGSMDDKIATLRDGLYSAGMLNAFHRLCSRLKIANIALSDRFLPMIIKSPDGTAFPTPLYFPFKMYRQMERKMLDVALWSPYYAVEKLGRNISSREDVPYIDITATISDDGKRIVLGIINRHPQKSAKVMLHLKGGQDNTRYRTSQAWEMTGPDPLSANTLEKRDAVSIQEIKLPKMRFAWMDAELRAASLMVITLER